MKKQIFTRIRDLGTENPPQYEFTLIGFAGKGAKPYPIGYLTLVEEFIQ